MNDSSTPSNAAVAARSDAPASAIPPQSPPWAVAPMIGFGVMLVSLAVIAVISLLTPPRIPTGLPQDPDVAEAKSLVANEVTVGGRGLSFVSALGVGSGRPDGETDIAVADRAQRCARAEAHLRTAAQRLRKDARITAALGHLALATDRLDTAKRRYLQALGRASSYGEARLGLGMALALEAETLGDDSPPARSLRLQALAQFAAVPERDPCFGAAITNRVVLLRRVGRTQEADQLAAGAAR